MVTNELGEYLVGALPPGRYLVTAALSGLKPSSSGIDVGTASATRNLELDVPPLAESVTVTATKTGAADVQSTPVAITVLPATALDQMGVHTVEDLAGVVPGVTISQHTGLAQVTIRGIGSNSTFGDPSSTVHLDGVYLGRPAMMFADFLNVERVEVLRGPQGTLYGRNSVGGTINIVTRQPTNLLETSVRLTAGNYQKLRAEGAVSGPLIKNRLMGNFALLRDTREGFVRDLNHPDHSLGSEDTWAGRGQLRIILGTQSELLLSGDYGRLDGVPLTYAKPIAAKPNFPQPFEKLTSLWTVKTNDLTSGQNIQQGASAKLAVRLNRTTTLTSLTAYRRSNFRFFIDTDATELPVQTSDVGPEVQHQVSQELTLVQRTPNLTWIGGGFFYEEHYEGHVEITVLESQTRPFAKVGVGAAALFGQATYTLTPRLSLTGGVRYTDERKDLHNTGGRYHVATGERFSSYDYVDNATLPCVDSQGQPPAAGVSRHVRLRLRDARIQERRLQPVQPHRTRARAGLQSRIRLEFRRRPETHHGRRTRPYKRGGVLLRLSGPAGAIVHRHRPDRRQQRRCGDHYRHRRGGDCRAWTRHPPLGPCVLARRDLRPLPLSRAWGRRSTRRAID